MRNTGVVSRRLALKISLVIVLIEIVVLGCLGWWYIVRYSQQIDDRLATQIALPGVLMQQGALRHAAVRDVAGLGRLIGQDISSAMVIKPDGIVYEAAEAAVIGQRVVDLVDRFEFDLLRSPLSSRIVRQPDRAFMASLSELTHEGMRIGWLYVRIDVSRAEAEKRALAWRYGLGTAGSILLTSLVQILLISRMLGRRIRNTVEVLAQAEQGDLKARVDGPLSLDEIGQLQSGVNAMISQTERRTHERLQAAADLEASEEKYRILVEHQSDMVVKVDLHNRLLYVSPSYCATFGKTAEELLGNSFMPLVHEDDREATAVAMATLTKPPYTARIEQRAMTPSGWRSFSWQDTLVRDASGVAVAIIGVGRDITQQAELQNQLRQSQKMDAIGQLAGGVAHDFNNLLTGIIGGCQLLERDLPDHPDTKRHLDMIQTSAVSAAELTGRLLSFARKTSVRRRTVVVSDVVHASIDLIRRSIDRRIKVAVDPGPVDLSVDADLSTLQNAIINLALNARDAMPDGGTLRVMVQELPADHGEPGMPPEPLVEISIVDSGKGIPPDVLPRIFEPFFTTKEAGKGTGLGLASVYSTMREHQGVVRVDSQPGCTEFRLLLPRVIAAPSPSSPSGAAPALGVGTILVVDDEPVLRELAVEMLGGLGYSVLTACDGEDGVAVVRKEGGRIRCVVVDLVMPRMSGADCFRCIRKIDPGLPVVLCSGYDRDSIADALLAEGAAAFVRKPYKLGEMAGAIATAARRPDELPDGASRT